jgi:hypothetical protein
MVQYATLDRTLGAISDPTRRQILDRLGRGPASITELAQPLAMSLTGLKSCRLGPSRLDDAFDWIEFYRKQWDRRLDGLEAYFEERKGDER